MTFSGFSLPDGAWLPPELLYILPEIQNLSELKVTIAALYESLRIGSSEAVISLSDFEALTGLNRKSVSRGIDAALKRGSITRKPVGGTYIYQIAIQTGAGSQTGRGVMTLPTGGASTPIRGAAPPIGGVSTPIRGAVPLHGCMDDINSDKKSEIQPSINHPTRGVVTLPDSRQALLQEMRDLGVALKVAQKLIKEYPGDYLLEKLRQTRYAVEVGLAQRPPGWFVVSVNENRQPPLGYNPDAHLSREELHNRYINNEYADLIQR